MIRSSVMKELRKTCKKDQLFQKTKQKHLKNSFTSPDNYCMKGFRIRSFSGPYFPAFGLNTDIYSVSLHIQSECAKIRAKPLPPQKKTLFM